MIGTALAAGGAGSLVFGAYYPNAWLFGPVIGRGPTDERVAYLSFDDGPNPSATGDIVETLARETVQAGFFLVGDHVRRHPALARAVSDAGHLVGNHTEHHQKLHVASPARIQRELEQAHEAIAGATRRAPRAFRAPHGYRNPFVARAVRRFGYRTFGWTFGVWDSDRPGTEEIRRRVRAKLVPGAIILLHDGDGYDPAGDRSQTARALPGIIRDARDAGYRLRPLAELIA